jgi:lauroyl/myristoyl acyltransferase
MDIIALVLALFGIAMAAASRSKIKILEKRISLIRRHVKFSDMEMLSTETKELIGKATRDECIQAISEELGISQEDAEFLMETIESESN